MHWIVPSEKDAASTSLEKRLWNEADQFWANSGLKAQEYSGPILGRIFMRFAEVRFAAQRQNLEKAGVSFSSGSRVDEPTAYHADNVLYLGPEARFDYLLTLPEAADIGARANAAMREVEKQNPQLAWVLPKTYNLFTSTLLKELLKKIYEIPAMLDFDAFGRIYEYFLGEFAMSEGQGGGEFYTPARIVQSLTQAIKPSPGASRHPLPVGEGQKSGTQSQTGRFDFVLANSPFNVNAVDKERLKDKCLTLQRQIQKLRRTRDLLLPRLLSGQIDVEAIDLA